MMTVNCKLFYAEMHHSSVLRRVSEREFPGKLSRVFLLSRSIRSDKSLSGWMNALFLEGFSFIMDTLSLFFKTLRRTLGRHQTTVIQLVFIDGCQLTGTLFFYHDLKQVHTFKKACAAVYPSVVQNDIVWFWPSSDPQYSDILSKKKPPYIPELDDPSFTKLMGNRDIPYGYDVLMDNFMDPAHLPYAHYGVVPVPKRKDSKKADREGGQPLEICVEKIDVDGFLGNQDGLKTKFMAPCVFYAFTPHADSSNGSVSSAGTKEESLRVAQKRVTLVFFCIPVSPGNSRLIWSFPRNFTLWIDQIIPRWIIHVCQNMVVLDSDLYLLHAEERKLMEIGPSNWQKACFLPTKADAQVIAFRRWFNKYAGGQVDWRTKFTGALPPTPPREQLMDRYWTHVVNCRSCKAAYTSLSALEVVLQVVSVGLIGIVAATMQNTLSVVQRNALICIAVLFFVGSRWLSHFIYKNFRFHDYNHAFR